MMDISFSWDANKARLNNRKHGVTFKEASTVFDDDYARIIYDPDHSWLEDRFVLLGMSCSLRILVVSHVYREHEQLIRIISVRKATRNEQKNYWELTK